MRQQESTKHSLAIAVSVLKSDPSIQTNPNSDPNACECKYVFIYVCLRVCVCVGLRRRTRICGLRGVRVRVYGGRRFAPKPNQYAGTLKLR